MSEATSNSRSDTLTQEERDVFERLADRYDDDDDIKRICELVLQSSEPSEEASS